MEFDLNIKTIITAIIIIALIIVLIFLLGNSKSEPIPEEEEGGPSQDVVIDPLNASYLVGAEDITLVDGRSELEIMSDSAEKVITSVWQEPALGDLNGDAIDDAALIIIHQPGGAGSFYHLAAALLEPASAQAIGTQTFFLGDRITPLSVFVDNNIIEIFYLDRDPDEPMSAEPSMEIVKRFRVRGDILVETDEEIIP